MIDTTLRLTISSKKNLLNILFLGILLIPWALGEYLAINLIPYTTTSLFTSANNGKIGMPILIIVIVLMFVWFVFWTLSGIRALYIIAWQLGGKEYICIDQDSIKIQKTVLGLGKIIEYPAGKIRDLRISPINSKNKTFSWPWFGIVQDTNNGIFSFDYDTKTFHFGDSIKRVEAAEILSEIVARFPNINAKVEKSG
jgi:hypothetical protein